MSDEPTEIQNPARLVWAAGNWDAMAEKIASVGPSLIDRVGLEPGMRVLDVGTGSGSSISVPAAQRGAVVVGSDLTPELFEDGRRRAADAGVEVEWVEADAAALPFGDGEFDRVFSTFGHMFAPDHAAAGFELARVCAPGGTVATACWTSDSAPGEMFKAMSSFMPPPPSGFEPPVLWGDEGHAREMLAPHGLELEFDRDSIAITESSVDALSDMYERDFGPAVMAKAALGDEWPAVRTELDAIWKRRNSSGDATARIESEYLVTIGRKPA